MSKNIDFEVGTIVTDEFLDNLQELLTGTINNIRLAPGSSASSVSLDIVGDIINDKLGTINIGGKYVYFDQKKYCEPAPSTPGSYPIYVSTTESLSGLTPPAFKLSIGLPAAYSFIRKIGTLSTTGSQVSNVKFNNGVIADADQYNSFTFKSVIDTPGETVLSLHGQDGQTSPAGATTTAPSSTPTKLISSGHTVSGNYTEYMYLDTAGRFVWENGGTDLTLSRIAADTLGSNAELSIRREGLNDTVGVDDPTLDGVETITRSDGVVILSGRVDADTNNRVQVSQTGVIMFGDGVGAPDTGLYRPKADSLALLNNDKLYLDYAINPATDGNNLAANKVYVDGAVGRAELDDLSDVDTTGVVDGALLVYDNGTATWVDTSGLTFLSNTLAITGDLDAVNAEFTGRTTHSGTSNDKVTVISSPGVVASFPTHNTLLCQTNTGDITITLPSTATDGDTLVVKDIDGGAGLTNDLILVGDVGVTIDGEANYVMGAPYDKIKLISYSGNWFLL